MPTFSTQKVTMLKRTLAVPLALIAAALGLAACGSSSSGSGKQLSLVAYSTPEAAFEKLIPAFEATTETKEGEIVVDGPAAPVVLPSGASTEAMR